MPEKKPDERRVKVRVPFIYGIEFEDAGESTLSADPAAPAKASPIKINDISSDGMQIVLQQFVPKEAKVKLSIKFPRPRHALHVPGEDDSIDCKVEAKIQWIRQNGGGKGYSAGIHFTRYEGKAAETINRYIEEKIDLKDELL